MTLAFIMILITLALAVMWIFWKPSDPSDRREVTGVRRLKMLATGIGGVLVLLFLVFTSVVIIGKDEVGQLVRIYGGKSLPSNRIIATNGENGKQADILSPGFHFIPFIDLEYDIEKEKVVEVKDNQFAFLVAKDGKAMDPGQTFADAFKPEEADKMLDAKYFLEHDGRKGPQTTILPPGQYRLNRFLWDVSYGEVTEIKAGEVGVIKSNVHSRVDFGNLKREKPTDTSPLKIPDEMKEALQVPLVPVGAIGIWGEALNPGRYYINTHAYSITMVDTKILVWEHAGGYDERDIDIELSQDGTIKQTEVKQTVKVPEGAAEAAIFVKVDNWDIPMEIRVVGQISPNRAPFVVASVGGVLEVEDRVISPVIRSIVRNVIGGGTVKDGEKTRAVQVLDLINFRDQLEDECEALSKPEALKAGVDLKEIRFGHTALPPELLVGKRREQLAESLVKAYMTEKNAQEKRVETERQRATAQQQGDLVKAEIEVQRSQQLKTARENEGQGEKLKLIAIAEGQKAQVDILGEEATVRLRMFELALSKWYELFEKNPQVLQSALENAGKLVPHTQINMNGTGGGTGLEGAAAIFGTLLNPGSATGLIEGTSPRIDPKATLKKNENKDPAENK